MNASHTSWTDQDVEATVASIDGAYDLISRQAMLRMESGDQILPFVRMFYGSPSTCLWEDELGNSQDIPQGEGGEQGDPSCHSCSHLGCTGPSQQCGRDCCRARRFAFLGDVYVICAPHRLFEVHRILEEELQNHATELVFHLVGLTSPQELREE